MLPVLTHPKHDSLRERSRELSVAEILSEEIQSLIPQMIETMHGDDGIGLAAPQIGKNIRMITIGKDADEGLDEDIVLFNPVWEKTNKRMEKETEGCLSVPNIIGDVQRYTDIEVTAYTKEGKQITFDAFDYFARVIQHEVDHLDGILFIDRATNMHSVDPITKKTTPYHPVTL